MTAAVSCQTKGLELTLPIEAIDSSPLNPRKEFDQARLDELAASLKTDGLLQPILVKRTVNTGAGVLGGDRYTIVAGERRWRAAKQLGWTEIQVLIRNDIDDATHVRLALLENLARSDLNPLEEAHGYQQLVDLGMTQEHIAEAVHRSRPAIANALRLLKAPEPVQAKLREGALQPSHVLPLLRYEAFPDVIVKLAEVAAERRTPSKELEKGFGDLGYEFQNAATAAKLAVAVPSYGVEFDVAEHCEKCPFNAFQPGRYTGFCLKPEHFRQLQKEARAVKKAEVQQAIEAVSADGTKVLQLRSLKYGQYENLSYGSVPKGCSTKCECRAIAMDGQRQVKICTNPARIRQLREEERRQEEAARKARMKDLSDRCGQQLEALSQVASRELAMIAGYLCAALDEKIFKQLCVKYGIQHKARRTEAIDFESFSQQQPLLLLKVATEAVLSRDLSGLHYRSEARFASWYAGPAPKASKAPKPSRKGKPRPEPQTTFDPDARVAEEIAADYTRLEREYAAETLEQDLEFAGAGA